MSASPDRARELRRRHRHERQAVIFGGLVAAMAVAALGATAVYTGVVDAPFSREFTTIAPETPEHTTLAQPCVADETMPVPYSEIQVRVLNGTNRAGLASGASNELVAREFQVLGTGNSPNPVTATAEVLTGALGVPAAYTLAAHIEGAIIQIDTREDATLDLVLGGAWAGMIEPGLVPLDASEALVPAGGCVPVAEALVDAGPPPAIDGDEDPAAPEDEAEPAPEA